MSRSKNPPPVHPLEAWLVEQVHAHQDRGGDRFDELNVAGWMLASGETSKSLWNAAKTVALHLLSVCERRGIIRRESTGWCKLVNPALTAPPAAR